MSVLSAAQSAMVRLVGRRPSTIFSTTDQTEMQIADLINEVATDIMKGHDWRAITKIATVEGDGTQAAFALPADYDRMVLAQSVHDGASWFWNYTPAGSMDEWMAMTHGNSGSISPGWWILLDRKLQFSPAPTGTATYPYISRAFGRSAPASGTGVITPISSFTKDDDTFLLDERLLTLGVIWRFREQKGIGYAEDLTNYEAALSQEQARDRGARVLRDQRRFKGDVSVAYPWALG